MGVLFRVFLSINIRATVVSRRRLVKEEIVLDGLDLPARQKITPNETTLENMMRWNRKGG